MRSWADQCTCRILAEIVGTLRELRGQRLYGLPFTRRLLCLLSYTGGRSMLAEASLKCIRRAVAIRVTGPGPPPHPARRRQAATWHASCLVRPADSNSHHSSTASVVGQRRRLA